MDDNHTTVAAEIRRALAALEAGEAGPSPDELSAAPVLNDWQIILTGRSHCLAGTVDGHPRLKEGYITTSHLVMLDSSLTWARTMSRFYRLRSPFDFVLSDGTDFSLTDVYGWPPVSVEVAQAKLADVAVVIRRLAASL